MGCWAGWRCLPSVHSLYLSIKPFHPSSGLGDRLEGAVTHSHGKSLCLSCTCSHVSMSTAWTPQICSLVPP